MWNIKLCLTELNMDKQVKPIFNNKKKHKPQSNETEHRRKQYSGPKKTHNSHLNVKLIA